MYTVNLFSHVDCRIDDEKFHHYPCSSAAIAAIYRLVESLTTDDKRRPWEEQAIDRHRDYYQLVVKLKNEPNEMEI